MTRIGALNEQVTLLARQRTPDGGGGAAIDWTEFASIAAAVESLSSRRDTTGRRDAGLYRQRITLRHREDITHDTRLTHNGVTYRVVSIRRVGEGRDWLQLDTEEVKP